MILDNKQVYIDSQTQLNDWINKLLLIPKFTSSLRTNQLSEEFLLHCLNLYDWISRKLDDKLSLESLLSKTSTLIESEYKFNASSVEIKSSTDLQDNLNYIKVWLSNNYSVDIENAVNHELESIVEPVESGKFSKKLDPATEMYKNIFTLKTNFDADASGNDASIDSLLKKTNALHLLNKDIEKGSIYIYLTKPKRNLFVKGLLTLLYAGAAFTALILVVFSVVFYFKPNTISDAGDKKTLSNLCFVSLLSFLFFTHSLNGIFNSFENENYKYSFSKKLFLSHMFYLIIYFIFWNILVDGPTGFSLQQQTVLKVMRPVVAASWSLLLTITIAHIICNLYLNPPRNEKLIGENLDKYTKLPSKQGDSDKTA